MRLHKLLRSQHHSNRPCPASGISTERYTSSDMADLACGIGLPVLVALSDAVILLRKEKLKNAPLQLICPLPDNCKDEFYLPAASGFWTRACVVISILSSV